jgi:hypothetical protein
MKMLNKISLPLVLNLNALSSLATGALLATMSGPLAGLTGISSTVLLAAGLFLFPFSAYVLYVAKDPTPAHVKLVSFMDFSWVAASVGLVALTEVTALGVAFVLAIALVVEVYGTLQIVGVRRLMA